MLRVVLKNGWQVDVKVSPLEEWGSFIQHFTGSKEHNIRLREYALKKHLSLSEHGIKILQDADQEPQQKKFSSEKEFYNFLGLKLIPPHQRVGKDELERYRL
jgi:DNA polymerase (family 10)